MSLAIYAAPFEENDSNDEKSYNVINKKKQSHNKTQKRTYTENFDSNKVNNILKEIHNKKEDDEDNSLGDYNFNPPPKPQSSGVDKTNFTNNTRNQNDTNMKENFKVLGKGPQPIYSETDSLELNDYQQYGNDMTNKEYYKKVLPNYENQIHKLNSLVNSQYSHNSNIDNDLLLQKLNYMINLLEENHDERTNNVTEEVVLYSFLGIFVIFVIDSFVRVGKYVR